jgi:hypothetical protein
MTLAGGFIFHTISTMPLPDSGMRVSPRQRLCEVGHFVHENGEWGTVLPRLRSQGFVPPQQVVLATTGHALAPERYCTANGKYGVNPIVFGHEF